MCYVTNEPPSADIAHACSELGPPLEPAAAFHCTPTSTQPSTMPQLLGGLWQNETEFSPPISMALAYATLFDISVFTVLAVNPSIYSFSRTALPVLSNYSLCVGPRDIRIQQCTKK